MRGPRGTRNLSAGAIPRRRGFSLPELLVAITLFAVIGAATISLLRGQSRFYRHQEDAVLAMQNVRAIADLLAADLRMASGSDLLLATADSLAFRSDIRRAVVCDSTSPDEAVVFMYDSVSATNLPPTFRGIAISPLSASTWSYADGVALAVSAVGAGPRTLCSGSGAPATAPDHLFRRLSGWSAAFPGGTPPVGTLVREYGRLTYSFGPSAGAFSLRRNSQEVATPFIAAAFTFGLDDGTAHASLSSPLFRHLSAITVTGQATGSTLAARVTRAVDSEIVLRNGAPRP